MERSICVLSFLFVTSSAALSMTDIATTTTDSANVLTTDEHPTTAESVLNVTNCMYPVPHVNVRIELTNGLFVGSVAVYSCSVGYRLVGNAIVVCNETGFWNASVPSCELVASSLADCGHVSAPNNGRITGQNGTTFAHVITFSCDDGYELFGDSTVTCLRTGLWSNSSPACKPVDCGDVNTPANGWKVTSNETTFGHMVIFYCHLGYKRVGASSSTCTATGNWSSGEPTCDLIDCGKITTPEHGSLHPSNETIFNTTVEFSCNHGYELKGTETSVCLEAGYWSHKPPVCELVDCGELSPLQFGFKLASNGTTVNCTVLFSCFYGYTMVGMAIHTCLATGNWDNEMPKCVPIDCGSPGEPENGTTTPEGSTYGHRAQFSCNIRFTLVGNTTTFCQSSGRWSSQPPKCVPTNSSEETGGTADGRPPGGTNGFSMTMIYGGSVLAAVLLLTVIITAVILYCRSEGIVCVCQIKTAGQRRLIQNSLYAHSTAMTDSSKIRIGKRRRHHKDEDENQYNEIGDKTKGTTSTPRRYVQSGSVGIPSSRGNESQEFTRDSTYDEHPYENDEDGDEIAEAMDKNDDGEHNYEMPVIRINMERGGSESSAFYLHPTGVEGEHRQYRDSTL